MKKEERIARYGEEAYEKLLARNRAWYKAHPEEAKQNHRETNRKGGKHYNKKLENQTKGLRGERNKIRNNHNKEYKQYKQIIAPESQLHHEWIPNTAEYRGLALVEAEAHMHGFVDVIEILDGKITVLTEEEVKRGKKQNEK